MTNTELQAVKEALEYYAYSQNMTNDVTRLGALVGKPGGYKPATEALKLLNAHIAKEKGELSDGYHTFNELYEHRHALFIAFANTNPSICWKSELHDDGTMFDGWFIAGADLPNGVITYHLPVRLWELFLEWKELAHAPEWDGHTSDDVIERLKSAI